MCLQLDKPGTRVFLLKFKEEESRNLFFWAQEPDASQDEDYCAAVNNLINADVQGGRPRCLPVMPTWHFVLGTACCSTSVALQ